MLYFVGKCPFQQLWSCADVSFFIFFFLVGGGYKNSMVLTNDK